VIPWDNALLAKVEYAQSDFLADLLVNAMLIVEVSVLIVLTELVVSTVSVNHNLVLVVHVILTTVLAFTMVDCVCTRRK